MGTRWRPRRHQASSIVGDPTPGREMRPSPPLSVRFISLFFGPFSFSSSSLDRYLLPEAAGNRLGKQSFSRLSIRRTTSHHRHPPFSRSSAPPPSPVKRPSESQPAGAPSFPRDINFSGSYRRILLTPSPSVESLPLSPARRFVFPRPFRPGPE